MSGIDYRRVLLCGLIAGVVIASGEAVLDSFIFAEDLTKTASDSGGVGMPLWRSAALAGTMVCYGIMLIWLYAAMRPRFGAGPRSPKSPARIRRSSIQSAWTACPV